MQVVPQAMTASAGGATIAWIGFGSYRVGVALDRPTTTTAGDAAMERYAAGDDAAFGGVYDALASRLHRYIRRQVKEPQASDDRICALCLGSLPMACFIGSFFGSSNGPKISFGGPTRKLPVNVLANPDSSWFSASCRSRTHAFCGSR